MTMDELITAIQAIRDDLSESRRYVRSQPQDALRYLRDAVRRIGEVFYHDFIEAGYTRMYVLARARENLRVAEDAILVSPEATEACLTLVLWELGKMVGRLERERDRENRDAELAEVFGVQD